MMILANLQSPSPSNFLFKESHVDNCIMMWTDRIPWSPDG